MWYEEYEYAYVWLTTQISTDTGWWANIRWYLVTAAVCAETDSAGIGVGQEPEGKRDLSRNRDWMG